MPTLERAPGSRRAERQAAAFEKVTVHVSRRRFGWVSVLALLALLASSATAEAARKPAPSFRNIPVKTTTPQGELDGLLTIYGFYTEAGKVWASGVLTGTLDGQPITTPARALVEGGSGDVNGPSTQQIRPLRQHGAVCPILFLEIGPIFLDLLGLELAIDPIVIELVARPGQGNLLGNLLCAIVGLFDQIGGGGGGLLDQLLGQIVTLLNRLLQLPGV